VGGDGSHTRTVHALSRLHACTLLTLPTAVTHGCHTVPALSALFSVWRVHSPLSLSLSLSLLLYVVVCTPRLCALFSLWRVRSSHVACALCMLQVGDAVRRRGRADAGATPTDHPMAPHPHTPWDPTLTPHGTPPPHPMGPHPTPHGTPPLGGGATPTDHTVHAPPASSHRVPSPISWHSVPSPHRAVCRVTVPCDCALCVVRGAGGERARGTGRAQAERLT
jgi:hypothetical protein